MKLKVQELNDKTFAEFGQVCVLPPAGKPEHSCDEFDWWPDTMVFDSIKGKYGAGIAVIKKSPFRQTCSERHMSTPEFMLAVNGDMLVIVGPPDYPNEPARLPELSRFAAFKVKAGEAILLKPGVWHYAAMPLKDEMYMYVIYASGTGEDDIRIIDFPEGGVLEIEI
jgi:ureidoglycolate hydrolase